MQTAARILSHTPVWVFALLAFLIWQGWQGLRSSPLPIWRVLIVPLVFLLLGLSQLVLARDHAAGPLLAWIVAALVFAALALWRGPRLLAVDRTSGTVTRPGSAMPLISNIAVFMVQYGVAVATAMRLEPQAAATIIGHAVSGACAGYFSAWTGALLRGYRKFGAAEGSH